MPITVPDLKLTLDAALFNHAMRKLRAIVRRRHRLPAKTLQDLRALIGSSEAFTIAMSKRTNKKGNLVAVLKPTRKLSSLIRKCIPTPTT